MGYLGLFVITFLSATILPFSSELLLIGMLKKNYSVFNCDPLWLKKVGMKETKIIKQQSIIQKYGAWLALVSWIPIIGDPLMIAIGFYRVPFIPFIILLVVGKAARYLVIGWIFV